MLTTGDDARPASVDDAVQAARRALEVEAAAVAALVPRLDARFSRAVELLHESRGRTVVSGLGKSGHIGSKLAATFASLGTPAQFVHAAEALHGDAGVFCAGDVLLALSNSGETPEVRDVAGIAASRGIPVIALTGCGGGSSLAAVADVVLDVCVDREADPHNLAPTASTTAALAMGDALAVALMVMRSFGPADFARHHPGGSLGRRLAGGQ